MLRLRVGENMSISGIDGMSKIGQRLGERGSVTRFGVSKLGQLILSGRYVLNNRLLE